MPQMDRPIPDCALLHPGYGAQTILLSALMTLSIKKELSPDLVQNASWPLFSGRPDLKSRFPAVAAYTLTWRSADKDTGTFSTAATKDLEFRLVRAPHGMACTLQIFFPHSTTTPRSP